MELSALFPSLSTQELRARWLQGRHHVEHGDVARLASLLDTPLAPRDFVPRAAYYCTFSAFKADGRGELAPLHSISAEHALQLYERGHTIQCSGAVPGLQSAESIATLRRELGVVGGTASVRTIFSPPGASDAFGWHFDTASVIAVQLHGSKRWQLAANTDLRFPLRAGHPSQPVRGPINRLPGFTPRGYGPRTFDTTGFAQATSIEMRPGSVLFDPGGVWHRTSTVGPEGSCSISFLFDPESWLSLLMRGLTSMLAEDERWREPIFGLTAPNGARTSVTASFAHRLQQLRAALERTSPEALLEHAIAGQLSTLPDPRSPLRRVPHTTASLEPTADGRWFLDLGGDEARVEIGPGLVAVCRWILASDSVPFSVETLLLATVPSPERLDVGRVERITALLGALETLGVVEPADPVLPP